MVAGEIAALIVAGEKSLCILEVAEIVAELKIALWSPNIAARWCLTGSWLGLIPILFLDLFGSYLVLAFILFLELFGLLIYFSDFVMVRF